MNARLKSERGLSLVEATIILMVLAVLTSVVAPSIADYVEDARNTKAKEDVEAIGTAIARLIRDSGLPCLSTAPTTTTPCSLTNRVDLLVGASGAEPTVTSSAYEPPADTINTTDDLSANYSVNWAGAVTSVGTGPGTTDENVAVLSADRDTFEDQLVTNDAGYTTVSFTAGGGPRTGLGWRGAYVSGPLGADPWGFTYQANTVFLTAATDAASGTGEGQRRGGWRRDVIVLSSGGNGIVQTAFGGTTNTGLAAIGDDVVYVIQGATR